MYKLEDLMGEPVIGSLYAEELQRVPAPDESSLFVVEKVLRRRNTREGKCQSFVKFRGYPEKFNRWVDSIEYIENVD